MTAANAAANLEEEVEDSRAPGDWVLSADAASYGDDYRGHLLEQYKLYVELAEKIVERRQTANTFFLSICTALITALGIAWPHANGLMGTVWFTAVSIAGIVLSVFWSRLLWSYRFQSAERYRVVHALERNLPVKPLAAEWKRLTAAKKSGVFQTKSNIETRVPWVFAAMFAAIGVIAIVLRVS